MFESGLIRDMAFVERPRERMEKLGAEALKDEELLALVLRTGYRGKGAVEVARDILAIYPPATLMGLPYKTLVAMRGMGASRASALLAGGELARRAQARTETGLPRIQTVQDILMQSIEIRSLKKEHLLAFFLNARHQLISKETISIGTLTASLAHPRLCAAQHKRGYVEFRVMWCSRGLESTYSRSQVDESQRKYSFTAHNAGQENE